MTPVLWQVRAGRARHRAAHDLEHLDPPEVCALSPAYHRCADCPRLVPLGEGPRCPEHEQAAQAQRQGRPVEQVYRDPRWPHVRHDVAERDGFICAYCRCYAPAKRRDPGIAAHTVPTQRLLEEHGLDACFDLSLLVWAHRSCAERHAPARSHTGGDLLGGAHPPAASRRGFSARAVSVDSAAGGAA